MFIKQAISRVCIDMHTSNNLIPDLVPDGRRGEKSTPSTLCLYH